MGEQANLPFTEKMATGEIFVGKPLEQDIALGMTKGPSAATIATIMRVKAHERHDAELGAYLEQGTFW